MRKVYTIEGLDCANCAAKLEHKMNELEGVQEAILTFATEQLRIEADDPDVLLPKLQQIADEMEEGVVIKPLVRGKKKPHDHDHDHDHDHEHHHHHHHDGEACHCGEEHDHDHDHEHHHHHHHDGEACHCGEDHDHGHEHQEHHYHGNAPQVVYTIEGLDCANCAAKLERRMNDLPEVEDVVLTFATKQLRVAAKDPDAVLPLLQKVADEMEEGVTIQKREGKKSSGASEGKGSKLSDNAREAIKLGIGIALFFVALALDKLHVNEYAALAVYILAYVVLGGEVILTALKNMTKGKVFDENFLMSIATIGAFITGEYPEAVGVMLFYQIGELFEEIAVSRSRQQIMEAADMRPEVVNLVNADGSIKEIDAEDAKADDVIVVRPGDRIPLDGIVVEGESRIDTSPVTGEPVPVSVKAGSELLSGCVNESGLLKVRVAKELSESMVTRILDSVENAAASKPKIDRFITRFARIYTPFVVILAALTAIIPSLLTGNWEHWIYTALTFLVISCPCALVLSVPLAFFAGIGAGSKQGILFKGGVSLEAMNDIKAVVMDKTGTITRGDFNVQKCHAVAGADEGALVQLAAACESASTHPIAQSIVAYAAQQKAGEKKEATSIEEIAGRGVKATFADGEALCGNRALLAQYGVELSVYDKDKAKETMAGSEVLLAWNKQYVGYLVIADTLKPESRDAIRIMNKKGLTTAMLTGDAKETADAIAKETGIHKVYAKCMPDDKVNHLAELRKECGGVMFIGDGINDAPVLAGADVGAAMGSGADAAIEAADVVFMNSSLMSVPEALRIAKKACAVSKQNVIFALAVKAAVMVLGLCGIASMWMAVFADSGVAMLCVLNSVRVLRVKK